MSSTGVARNYILSLRAVLALVVVGIYGGPVLKLEGKLRTWGSDMWLLSTGDAQATIPMREIIMLLHMDQVQLLSCE